MILATINKKDKERMPKISYRVGVIKIYKK